jgi:signal transduction histidine kinase
LRQVLINLLSNAIKYNRRGGRVVVHAGPAGDKAVLRVRDTGRGLTPVQLASLFEPFNRFGAENEGIEGTGIGLTIVKALVEGMGGRVAVSSKPGEGTLFEVSLAPATDGLARPSPRSWPIRRRRRGASRATSAPGRSSTSRTTRSTCCCSRSW